MLEVPVRIEGVLQVVGFSRGKESPFHVLSPEDTLTTAAWLRKLQKDDPTQYKKVFVEFKAAVQPSSGGRAKRRQPWKPQQLVTTKTTEATKQSRFSGNFEEMRFGRYLLWFTKECDPDDRMTDAEARIAWVKEDKTKIKIFNHKTRKEVEVEVVPVEVNRTMHQEQMLGEKRSATVVLSTQNDASEQAIAQAVGDVKSNISMSFEDDMFSAA